MIKTLHAHHPTKRTEHRWLTCKPKLIWPAKLIAFPYYFSGSYGYVDPDGEKREFTYETGIKCDPNKRDEEDEEELEEELQYKNVPSKAKRPQPQQQQQQYYRN